MKLIVQSVLEEKIEKMAGISKRCSCSSVKSFEFLIGLDETPQDNKSDRTQIETKCNQCEVVGFEFCLIFRFL